MHNRTATQKLKVNVEELKRKKERIIDQRFEDQKLLMKAVYFPRLRNVLF